MANHYADHYLEVFRIAQLTGEIMLKNGAETYRVEDTITRILRTTGFAQIEAFTTLTGITISLGDPSIMPITSVKRVQNRSNHLRKVEMANDISRKFVGGQLSTEEALRMLENINTHPFVYPRFVVVPVCAMACGCFCILFGGNIRDFLATSLVGTLYGCFTILTDRLAAISFIKDLLCSALIGFFSLLLTHVIPLAEHMDLVIAGSIMPLVPGLAITNAIRDTLYGDYLSGLARALEACITAIVIAGGASIVIRGYEAIYHLSLAQTTTEPWLQDPAGSFFQWSLGIQLVASFFSALSFCLFLNVSRKHLLYCGLCGVVCWFFYQLGLYWNLGSLLATFFATFLTSFLAGRLAYLRRAPATVFFAAAIINPVPGYGMYRFMFHLIGQEYATAGIVGIETLECAALIAIAIALQYSIRSVWTQWRTKRISG